MGRQGIHPPLPGAVAGRRADRYRSGSEHGVLVPRPPAGRAPRPGGPGPWGVPGLRPGHRRDDELFPRGCQLFLHAPPVPRLSVLPERHLRGRCRTLSKSCRSKIRGHGGLLRAGPPLRSPDGHRGEPAGHELPDGAGARGRRARVFRAPPQYDGGTGGLPQGGGHLLRLLPGEGDPPEDEVPLRRAPVHAREGGGGPGRALGSGGPRCLRPQGFYRLHRARRRGGGDRDLRGRPEGASRAHGQAFGRLRVLAVHPLSGAPLQGGGGTEEGRRLCQEGLRMVRGRRGGDPVPAVEGPVPRQGGDRRVR